MIRRAVTRRPEAILDVTVNLWERLASELISIIGEGGFQSLYSRSMHLTSATFPWLVLSHPWQRADSRFADLKISLEGRDFPEASEASITLLITFIDILALLIGEHLTTSMLRLAWGDDALDIAEKELR
ncbi:MAG: hypothetical protein JWQ21_1076 [Herminiimonas sp.]|nr:hypothetical protein [Herminiimonas sp.]